MKDQVSEIRAVLVPLHGRNLLLPNLNIAEILGFRAPDSYEQTVPPWLLGSIHWHDWRFPLISFERLLGSEAVEPGHRARILVCHTLSEDPQRLPYIGVVARAIPRLIRVTLDSITLAGTAAEENPVVLHQVLVTGQPAVIPDLDAVEDQILRALAE